MQMMLSEALTFPGLGLEFRLDPVAFTVFGWPIRWYGIIFAGAALVAMLYVLRRVREFGVDADRMTDVLLGSIIGGMVGARAYYVAFTWNEFGYAADPTKIFRIWEGGIAMYGGVIGAVLCGFLLCRIREVRFLPALDVGLNGLILAQAIGRWGNFVNMEAFGSNTAAPWGMTGPAIVRYLEWQRDALALEGVVVDPYMPVHPTFFYESMWCLLGFAFLVWYAKRRRFDGEMSLLYLAWYGLGRAVIEGLRTDSLMLGGVRISQLLAVLCVLAAGAALLAVRSRIRRAGEPALRPLYVNTEEGQAVVAGTFYKKSAAMQAEDTASETAGKGSVDPMDAVSDAEAAAEPTDITKEDGTEYGKDH